MHFGKTYCINLKKRTDRWEVAQKEFAKINITPERFDAIPNVQGYIGCMLSHMKVIEICQNERRFSIFEDDVQFIGNPMSVLKVVDKQLPHDWHMLYLGAYLQKPIERYSDNLYRLKGAYAAHAIIFNSAELAKFIVNSKYDVYDMQKIDMFYEAVVQEIFNVYIVSPIIATQSDTVSDITKRRNGYYGLIVNNFKRYAQ